jgi:DNA-binding response OmpR family regulator
MVRVIIVEDNNQLYNNIAVNLQTAGYTLTPASNKLTILEQLSAAAANLLNLPNLHDLNAVICKLSQSTDSDVFFDGEFALNREQGAWRLNVTELELFTPNGKLIPLSFSECCVLKVAANTNGKLVSRKALIEALGHDYWQYDERCLETLMSRLRRKLAAYDPESFPVRGVRGRGYWFGAEILPVLA